MRMRPKQNENLFSEETTFGYFRFTLFEEFCIYRCCGYFASFCFFFNFSFFGSQEFAMFTRTLYSDILFISSCCAVHVTNVTYMHTRKLKENHTFS